MLYGSIAQARYEYNDLQGRNKGHQQLLIPHTFTHITIYIDFEHIKKLNPNF